MHFNVYALLPLLSAGTLVVLSVYLQRYREVPAVRPFTGLLMVTTGYSLASALVILSTELSAKIFWNNLRFALVDFVGVSILITTVRFGSGDLRLSRAVRAALFVIPALTALLSLASSSWVFYDKHVEAPYPFLVFRYGTWFWVYLLYSYALIATALGIIVRSARKLPRFYAFQHGLFFAGLIIPVFFDFLAIFHIFPRIRGFNLAPATLTVTAILIGFAMVRYRLFDIMPVARHHVVETMQDGVIVSDVMQRIVDANPAAERMLKICDERVDCPLLGQPLGIVLVNYPQWESRYTSDEPVELEIAPLSKAENRVFSVRIMPLDNPPGHRSGSLTLLRDITAGKQAEVQIRKLSQAIEQSPVCVVITDLEGRIEYVNRRFIELTGYRFDEVQGQNSRLLQSGQTPPETYPALWKTILAGQTWRGEFANRKKNGDLYWEEATIAPVIGDHGQITHFIAVKEDITRRKQAEDEREQLIRDLDAYAQTVAHDLKNPLAVVLGSAAFLAELDSDQPLTSNDREMLSYIALNAERMNRIIEELLLFASVRKQDQVKTAPLDMEKIVQGAVGRLVTMISNYHAEIVLPGPDEWPVAVGYAPWVEEIWANYLSNAIKYGGKPPVIRAGAEVQDGVVRFWVSDNGPGIPPEHLPHLFAPFTRFEEIRAQGNGLGLSIVQRIVDRLGGQVSIQSLVGEGSVFSFTLPRSRS